MNAKQILKTIEEKISDDFEKDYFLTHEVRYKYILEKVEDLAKKTNTVPMKVLDVGCYPYHVSGALEMMGNDVYGISSSHEQVKNKKVVVCNIESEKFPFEDNFFDLVVCTEVLEHLPQAPLRALREMYRVTKPGGHVLVTLPNIARSINRGKLLLGKSVMYQLDQLFENDGKGSLIYNRHNREYTLSEIIKMMKHEKWNIEKSTHFISYTPFRRRNRSNSFLLKSGKIANYILMKLFPSLRDTLFVLGSK